MQDYWTRDIAGFYAMRDAQGEPLKYVSIGLARADRTGVSSYPQVGEAAPYCGYWFCAMRTDETGRPYQQRLGTSSGRWNNTSKYAFCAYPADGTKEDFVLIINEEGVIYMHEGVRAPVLQWPGPDPTLCGWRLDH